LPRHGSFVTRSHGSLLSGGSPLEDPLRSLELGASSRAEVPAAIDEVLNHSDSRPETAWGYTLVNT
jgi:hypothetical protein